MWPEHSDIVSHHKPSQEWVRDSQNVDRVVRWFKNTVVVSSASEESDRNWIKEVVAHSAFKAFLKRSVVRLAYHCFREPTSAEEVSGIYFFVNELLSKVKFSKPRFYTRLISDIRSALIPKSRTTPTFALRASPGLSSRFTTYSSSPTKTSYGIHKWQ